MHIKKNCPISCTHMHFIKNIKMKKKKIYPQHAFRNNKYYFHCECILIKNINTKIIYFIHPHVSPTSAYIFPFFAYISIIQLS